MSRATFRSDYCILSRRKFPKRVNIFEFFLEKTVFFLIKLETAISLANRDRVSSVRKFLHMTVDFHAEFSV